MSMISVTEKAKERIINLRSEEGRTDNQNIRVSVKGGGCSGLMYDLGFDAEIKPADQIFEDKGIKILVDKKSLLYLLGTTLDFSDGLNGKGFQFINPNASRTCGCGESFSVYDYFLKDYFGFKKLSPFFSFFSFQLGNLGAREYCLSNAILVSLLQSNSANRQNLFAC